MTALTELHPTQLFSGNIDAILTVGSGTDTDGVSRATIYNGIAAAAVANEYGVPVITSGYAPTRAEGLPPEADAQSEIVQTLAPNVAVVSLPTSTTTHENVIEASPFIDEFGISKLGIVAARGHVHRLAHLLKKRHGDDLRVELFVTPEQPSKAKIVEQFVLLGIAKYAYRNVEPQNPASFQQGGERYTKIVSLPKRLKQRFSQDPQYKTTR